MYDVMATNTSSGWNRPSGAAKPVQKKPSALRGVVAGLVVVVLALAGAWYFLGDSLTSAAPKETRSRTIKDKSYKKLDDISRIKPRKEYAAKPKTVEEALQRVQEAQEPMKLEPMPKVESKPTVKRTFHTGTEQVLSWLCHTELGEPPMPPPPIPETEMENLANILVSKNEIEEDDSPEAANAKQMVDAAKKEMVKFIKEGGDPDEFMQYVFREQMKAFETRNTANEMYEEILENDPEMAREFAKKANEKLAEQGIMPIHIPEESEVQEQQEEVRQ